MGNGPGAAIWVRPGPCRLLQVMGIVSWASARCNLLPSIHKLFFVHSEKLIDLLDFAYRLLRLRLGDEFLLLNNSNLAFVLGDEADQIKSLMEEVPSWVLIIGVAGRDRLPRERVEFQERDIADIAQQFALRLVSAIPGVSEREVLEVLLRPSNEPYWKLRYKGGCQEIFFVTTINRTPEFINTMYSVSQAWRYPTSDIGIYIQPVMLGEACHCEFLLPYDPRVPREVSRIQGLLTQASAALMRQGAFFSRPYGPWASMAFAGDAQTVSVLKKIKAIFDPNNIMNPGKLCF